MSRTISTELLTHIALPVTTLALCVKVKRRDGTILGFTSCDLSLSIDLDDDDGSTDYNPESAMQVSARSHVSGLSADNLSFAGMLTSTAIDDQDVRAGLYDFAEVTVFKCNYEDLTQGVLLLHKGWWGEVTLKDNQYSAEVRPLTDAYSQTVGEIVTPGCSVDLGDTKCKVRLDPPEWEATTDYTVRQAKDASTGSVVKPSTENGCHFKCTVAGTSDATEPTWDTTVGNTTTDGTVTWEAIKALTQTGTVSAVTDRDTFTATGISLGADWWTLGTITWLTGDNADLKGEVKSDNGTGTINLYLQAAYTIAVGDTFTITAGCSKIGRTDTSGCVVKFDNFDNFRGFPDVPGANVAMDYPDAAPPAA